ncbi:uncharacterized protein LOC122291029 [Carya illinoinensis]|uniref:uncharacterized protein LOC122291029 n=1 Tax=Carya illinoinensis TaxID=32201 RepID=UPI001C729483|nr:uncharacterized protein LOC122291029 [Carya illinoinensis]
MIVAKGPLVMVPPRLRSFAELVQDSPQPIPEVLVPFQAPKTADGEVCILFTKDEIDKSAFPFWLSIVLKFLRQRPSLDSIRAFIHSRWGLINQPIVSSMLRPRNAFIRMSYEEDFVKALTRKATDIDGVAYRVFKWTIEFQEDKEPVNVLVWISFPGPPPNFYHDSFLRSITAPLGQYLKWDNPTKCATPTEGARVCIGMDVSKEPLTAFWIGIPRQSHSFLQEVIYEMLPAYCTKCSMQGHDDKTCKRNA